MYKKADFLGIPIIILFVLGIIILLVVSPIIIQKIPELWEQMISKGEEASQIERNCAAQGFTCTTPKVCSDKGAERPEPENGWIDCKTGVCCQII